METQETARVYIVEDNEWYQKLIQHSLSLNPLYQSEVFSTGNALLNQLKSDIPDAITIDYRLPDMDGVQLLESIKMVCPQVQVIVISEQDDIETAVSLLKQGAYDYISKGNDIRNRLLNTLDKALHESSLKKKIQLLEQEVQTKYNFSENIIGNSSRMRDVYKLIQKACTTSITVSINGETGTGKEVVAKAIHFNSTSKDKPFVAVNMGAIPFELFESELFGHEKGSFTGAMQTRIGKFEEANGGTLFLDEIAELNIALQVKLLRALQEREITRVGGNKTIPFQCRIIVATHKNLLDEVKKGNFREDLFYRLFGLSIELPPLRQRENDILLLSNYFISQFCIENKINQPKLSVETQHKLLAYAWPGNIRELKSVIELAIVMSNGISIEPHDIVITNSDILSNLVGEELTLRQYNRKIVQLFLDKYDNNTRIVADKLDIGQTTVYRIIKEMES